MIGMMIIERRAWAYSSPGDANPRPGFAVRVEGAADDALGLAPILAAVLMIIHQLG
jgi:hypothetical protein